MNLDEYESIGTHWIALYLITEIVSYFGSFGDEHILKEIRKFNGIENITRDICRTSI